MKKNVSMILAALLLAVTPTVISAAVIDPGNQVIPYWEYMNSAEVGISFSGTSGTASVTVDRYLGITTSLEATLTVYKKVGNSWVYVTSTSDSSTRNLNIELDFTGVSGTTYKAVADITAYGDDGSESDSISETATC